MKTVTFITIFFLTSITNPLQAQGLFDLINDQVSAFNQQDVNKLVSNVTDDMKYFYITSNELITETSGKQAFKLAMTNYFKTGHKPQSEIVSHVIDGSRISFKEVVSHINKKG